MTVDLGGRVALVTGASRGIGHAVARRLGESGARVALHYGRNQEAAEALALAIGNGSRAFGADLEVAGAGQSLWNEVVARMGRVDVVIANAGIFARAPLEGGLEDWLASWYRTMAVNLR
ncbi:SDR family NAD(P)-dependent oxidoreductase, partial [Rubrivirga sp.]|uniref:SDR family NAD(P)-dependent oxidoreductase n=1 Tax=Rubrivirga sp. TaxID=1885344 RepID=UPI003C795B19